VELEALFDVISWERVTQRRISILLDEPIAAVIAADKDVSQGIPRNRIGTGAAQSGRNRVSS
jgi:hypothetical protein